VKDQLEITLPASHFAHAKKLETTQVRTLPRDVSDFAMAQAIVDLVECEAAYLEQATERIRRDGHADGAEARLPRARARLKALAKRIIEAQEKP